MRAEPFENIILLLRLKKYFKISKTYKRKYKTHFSVCAGRPTYKNNNIRTGCVNNILK